MLQSNKNKQHYNKIYRDYFYNKFIIVVYAIS